MENDHGIKFTVHYTEETEAEDQAISGFLFHAAKELIVNVVKHSKAENVIVKLDKFKDRFNFEIADDGIGFRLPEGHWITEKTGGFGLFSIRERIEGIGGSMTVKSSAGAGTVIKLVVPPEFK